MSRLEAPVPLEEADDEARFGGKAVQLGRALRALLPVPEGFAIPFALVDRVASGDGAAASACAALFARLGGGTVAVRSSAVGEDGAAASFAGQHLTRLAVAGAEAVARAVVEVWASGHAAGALAYRRQLGLAGEPRVGVVVQRMVAAECAGVMFTRCPMTGDDVRVIEAAWGLGEAVVSGLVDPDRYRVARGGAALEVTIGEKAVAVRPIPGGSTAEVPVEDRAQRAACLDARRLAALDALASRCEASFGGRAAHDIEWAFEGERLYLLQRRAVTT